MHRDYFPACPVDGPIEPPVPFSHMVIHGAVPQKCGQCQMLFEGSCVRHMEQVGHYLHLDYGPCGIPGPTDPVIYENNHIIAKAEIPRKCASCCHLKNDSIRGFFCSKDREIWGDFPRSLDWGTWTPDFVYLQLPLPKISTKNLSRFAYQNDLVAFVQEYRRINPGSSLAEAREDFAGFRKIIEQHGTFSKRSDSQGAPKTSGLDS